MKIIIPLRRVIEPEFVESLKALSKARGLDTKHCHHLSRCIRQAKDAAHDHGQTVELLREKHGGELAGNMILFKGGGNREKGDADAKAFRSEIKAVLATDVVFEMLALMPIPEGLTADHAAEIVEFFSEPNAGEPKP